MLIFLNEVRQQHLHSRLLTLSPVLVFTVKCIKCDVCPFKIVSLHFDVVSSEIKNYQCHSCKSLVITPRSAWVQTEINSTNQMKITELKKVKKKEDSNLVLQFPMLDSVLFSTLDSEFRSFKDLKVVVKAGIWPQVAVSPSSFLDIKLPC